MNTSQLLYRYYIFFACGDAVGKATEFMTPQDIESRFGRINGLPDISKSLTHSDLHPFAVTDDTEQNLWLIKRYLADGEVTIENTVDELLKWIDGTDAIKKHYIGPSSLKALQGIKNGEDPLKAGINGTTCGGIMRVWTTRIPSISLRSITPPYVTSRSSASSSSALTVTRPMYKRLWMPSPSASRPVRATCLLLPSRPPRSVHHSVRFHMPARRL